MNWVPSSQKRFRQKSVIFLPFFCAFGAFCVIYFLFGRWKLFLISMWSSNPGNPPPLLGCQYMSLLQHHLWWRHLYGFSWFIQVCRFSPLKRVLAGLFLGFLSWGVYIKSGGVVPMKHRLDPSLSVPRGVWGLRAPSRKVVREYRHHNFF
jgi:hypothetical protein